MQSDLKGKMSAIDGGGKAVICVEHCCVKRGLRVLLADVSWTMKAGEAWLITGPNGGGKAPFLDSLANRCFVPREGGAFECVFNKIEAVSLERAARLIQEERERDDSEYLDGGIDRGRSGAAFISEAFAKGKAKGNYAPISELLQLPEVKLCAVEGILERGLKYMSTGEIRRVLLCRALLSGADCLILSDPFAGLDKESRTLLRSFFNKMAQEHSTALQSKSPTVILGMERYTEIPDAITHVLEFSGGKVCFCGRRSEYEKKIASVKSSTDEDKECFSMAVMKLQQSSQYDEKPAAPLASDAYGKAKALIEMNHVNVGWDGKLVLRDLTWTLYEGEHWLIRGPNGAGKTTFLELITGDNGQVYANDVRMFGKRRGTGETMWDIKARLGIVSYRMHVEYRMVGGTSILDTVVSGFRDSIGLYGAATDIESKSAKKWLALAGFGGRENEAFSSLSYGEQRSILILRAAVKCPKILILDEPCHGLSEEARSMVLNIMQTIAESGSTTLLHVTHEMDEMLPCEHHILELNPSKVPMYRVVGAANAASDGRQ